MLRDLPPQLILGYVLLDSRFCAAIDSALLGWLGDYCVFVYHGEFGTLISQAVIEGMVRGKTSGTRNPLFATLSLSVGLRLHWPERGGNFLHKAKTHELSGPAGVLN